VSDTEIIESFNSIEYIESLKFVENKIESSSFGLLPYEEQKRSRNGIGNTMMNRSRRILSSFGSDHLASKKNSPYGLHNRNACVSILGPIHGFYK
jgi:hypothetical protein